MGNAGVKGYSVEKGDASTKGGGQLVLLVTEKEVGPCLTPHRSTYVEDLTVTIEALAVSEEKAHIHNLGLGH